MVTYYIFFVLACFCSTVSCSQLPSFIRPCPEDVDSDVLSECALLEARRVQKEFCKGIPELGVETLDPLHVGKLDINAATLTIKQKNVTVKGASKLEIREIKFDKNAMTGRIAAYGNLTAFSDYDVVGRLLVIPISGHGKLKVKMENTEIVIRYKSKLFVGDDGRQHFKLYDVKPSHKFGHVRIRMDGLFGDDKTISETVNQVMNDNWRDLMKDFGPPSVKAVTDKTIAIINSFYDKVPYEDLYAPT